MFLRPAIVRSVNSKLDGGSLDLPPACYPPYPPYIPYYHFPVMPSPFNNVPTSLAALIPLSTAPSTNPLHPIAVSPLAQTTLPHLSCKQRRYLLIIPGPKQHHTPLAKGSDAQSWVKYASTVVGVEGARMCDEKAERI